jgi:hypothetical protein
MPSSGGGRLTHPNGDKVAFRDLKIRELNDRPYGSISVFILEIRLLSPTLSSRGGEGVFHNRMQTGDSPSPPLEERGPDFSTNSSC